MAEPAFVGAGSKAGLELWRIEALKPVKIPDVSSLSIKQKKKIDMKTQGALNQTTMSLI